MSEPVTGDGWTVAHLDDLGSGAGFRKIRTPLGVTAFGVNAVVLPPGYSAGRHYHDEQQELYFVHRGTIEFSFGDGENERTQVLRAGSLARVDPQTIRGFRNLSEDEEAIFVCVGGKDGYVGRDGRVPEDNPARHPTG